MEVVGSIWMLHFVNVVRRMHKALACSKLDLLNTYHLVWIRWGGSGGSPSRPCWVFGVEPFVFRVMVNDILWHVESFVIAVETLQRFSMPVWFSSTSLMWEFHSSLVSFLGSCGSIQTGCTRSCQGECGGRLEQFKGCWSWPVFLGGLPTSIASSSATTARW